MLKPMGWMNGLPLEKSSILPMPTYITNTQTTTPTNRITR
jgi:hypothetical protein